MTKEQASKTEPVTPWRNLGFGNDFTNWYEWMKQETYAITELKVKDAVLIYYAMRNAMQLCHNNHPAVEKE